MLTPCKPDHTRRVDNVLTPQWSMMISKLFLNQTNVSFRHLHTSSLEVLRPSFSLSHHKLWQLQSIHTSLDWQCVLSTKCVSLSLPPPAVASDLGRQGPHLTWLQQQVSWGTRLDLGHIVASTPSISRQFTLELWTVFFSSASEKVAFPTVFLNPWYLIKVFCRRNPTPPLTCLKSAILECFKSTAPVWKVQPWGAHLPFLRQECTVYLHNRDRNNKTFGF